MGTLGFVKTVKKSEHWSKHGKSKGRVVVATETNRQLRLKSKIKQAHKEPMYGTVREAFDSAQ